MKFEIDNRISLLCSGNALPDLSHAFSSEDACKILGRNPRPNNFDDAKLAVCGKTVCVTGGAGSIGSEICRLSLELGCKRLVVIDRHENGVFGLDRALAPAFCGKYDIVIADVRDKLKIKSVFKKYKPDVVFHAAAYKHVPLMETAVCEAVKNNVFGTKNVLECANDCGATNFVLISSDKAVHPSSVMGATKRIAEMLVCSYDKSVTCSAVRFGNVFGSSGSVVPIFVSQILSGKPVTVTDKRAVRYFMTVTEAVSLVFSAGNIAKNGEIFVLDMGEPINVYTLAENLIKYFGYTPNGDVEIQITSLRAGEKLFEQLCYDREPVDRSSAPGVFITKPEPIDQSAIDSLILRLTTATELNDDAMAEKIIFSAVKSDYRK